MGRPFNIVETKRRYKGGRVLYRYELASVGSSTLAEAVAGFEDWLYNAMGCERREVKQAYDYYSAPTLDASIRVWHTGVVIVSGSHDYYFAAQLAPFIVK